MSATHGSGPTESAAPQRRAGDRPTPGTALVPLHWSGPTEVPAKSLRPDATFLAHLMAMRLESPQTRSLRRAAIADVQAAYRSTASQDLRPAPNGDRMHKNI